MYEDEDINNEAWLEAVDEIEPKRKAIAYERACKRVGIETEWVDGVLHIFAEEETDELLEAFTNELDKMVIQDSLDELRQEGMVNISTNEDGELMYSLTDEGRAVAEEILDEEDLGP